MTTTVTLVVGFTERDRSGELFSSRQSFQMGGLRSYTERSSPGYRTVIQPGTQLPVISHGPSSSGILICNDIWYLEPVRVLSAAGAAVLFVPSNSGRLPKRRQLPGCEPAAKNLPIARAVENTTTVVVSDIAGRQRGRVALGSSRIIDPDGAVLACADPYSESLLVADVEGERRSGPRGWDGYINPAVTTAFLGLWNQE